MTIPALLARRSTAGPAQGLAAWAASWLGGRTGTDDVVAALAQWAQVHVVSTRSPVDAGADVAGFPDLLVELRRAAPSTVRLLLPAPGDSAVLPGGSELEVAALARGEAVTFDGATGSIALVPTPESSDVLCWNIFHITPALPHRDSLSLGEAEYALRGAVRDAASALAALPPAPGTPSARATVAELAQYLSSYPLPPVAGERAHRVLDTAATVEAILLVAEQQHPDAGITLASARAGDAAYASLWRAVRAARSAAIDAIARDALSR